MKEITYNSSTFYDDIASSDHKHVHLIMIATKPDIIKQVPLYLELKRRGQLVLLGHTGQHYDENLSGGMLKEFGVTTDFNLNVRGEMHDVVSQIIGRLGYIIGELKERGKIVIPYIHGDTTTCMASGNAGFCHQFSSVHVEAGIRTLTPDYGNWQLVISSLANKPTSQLTIAEWRKYLMQRDHWNRGSLEPFPEQFNTRCAEPATGIHLAPVELDREFMLGEGFCNDRIFVVGNSVADATHDAMKRMDQSTIFDRHPKLEDGDFVRFCIHRRENCLSEKRFRAIYDAMKSLIKDGRNVLLINMIQTKKAFERFGLTEELSELEKSNSNFILSEVWSEYVDVITAMDRAAVCATDSGSMQEEMNVMGVPCVTLRFGSDRSESIMNGGNLIAPPAYSGFIKKVIEYAWDNEEMRSVPKLYGKDVSKKCVDVVLKVLEDCNVFRKEEERLGIKN